MPGGEQFISIAKTSMPPVARAGSIDSQFPVMPTNTSSIGNRWTSSWPVSIEPMI